MRTVKVDHYVQQYPERTHTALTGNGNTAVENVVPLMLRSVPAISDHE